MRFKPLVNLYKTLIKDNSMAKTYGIISDAHRVDPRMISVALERFQTEDVDEVILNGDVVGDQFRECPNDAYLGLVLSQVAQLEVPCYLNPGSHEALEEMEPVVAEARRKLPHFRFTVDQPRFEQGDHDLVFLPGSDWRPGSARYGYVLNRGLEMTGYHAPPDELRYHVSHMDSLRGTVTRPEQTLLVSHIPRQFDNTDTGVDVAEYCQPQLDIVVGREVISAGTIIPGVIARPMIEQGAPLEILRENRGNEGLREVCEDIGITKQVNGHFHESAHNAHDLQGNPVEEDTELDQLFLNASCLDRELVSMVRMDGDKVLFKRIDLN
jgi:hypothetical protein